MSQLGFRDALVDRIRVDLLGPDAPDELIADLPSDRYMTGILYTEGTEMSAADDDDFTGADNGDEPGDSTGREGPQRHGPAAAGLRRITSAGPPLHAAGGR